MIWEMQWNWMVAELARKNISLKSKDWLRAKVVQQPSLPFEVKRIQFSTNGESEELSEFQSAKTKWFGLAPSLMAWWLVIYQSDHKQTSLRRQHQPIWLLTKVASMESLVALQNIPISFSNTLSQEEHLAMLSLPRTRCDFSRSHSKQTWMSPLMVQRAVEKRWVSKHGAVKSDFRLPESIVPGFTEESFIGYQTLMQMERWSGLMDFFQPLCEMAESSSLTSFARHDPKSLTAWNAVGDSGVLLLVDNNNEVVVAHKDFNILYHESSWGSIFWYEDVNQATLDPFGMNMKVEYLDTESRNQGCMRAIRVWTTSLSLVNSLPSPTTSAWWSLKESLKPILQPVCWWTLWKSATTSTWTNWLNTSCFGPIPSTWNGRDSCCMPVLPFWLLIGFTTWGYVNRVGSYPPSRFLLCGFDPPIIHNGGRLIQPMQPEKEVKQLRNEINELHQVENLKRMLDGFADVLRPRMANAGVDDWPDSSPKTDWYGWCQRDEWQSPSDQSVCSLRFKRGLKHSNKEVHRYIHWFSLEISGTWKTFLANHFRDQERIWCDWRNMRKKPRTSQSFKRLFGDARMPTFFWPTTMCGSWKILIPYPSEIGTSLTVDTVKSIPFGDYCWFRSLYRMEIPKGCIGASNPFSFHRGSLLESIFWKLFLDGDQEDIDWCARNATTWRGSEILFKTTPVG